MEQALFSSINEIKVLRYCRKLLLMQSFEDNVFEWASSHRLFDGVKRVLLAVSGGADSVAMAVALQQLIKCRLLSIEPVIGHVNHGLRGADSDTDEAFVFALGERMGVRVVCKQMDVHTAAQTQRLSIETAGRLLRQQALTEMARDNNCIAIATAHHADDQAETLVHRLMRGTGLRGLCGIRPETTHHGMRFIRPLLGVRRTEIETFCRINGLAWREDASNRSCAFTRNRIRHRMMPELERQMPNAAERLAGLAELCRKAQQQIEASADSVKVERPAEHEITYRRSHLTEQSPWVQAELLGRAVQALGGGLRDMTCRHYQTLMADAAEAGSTKTIWPGRITVAVESDRIVVSKAAEDSTALPSEPVQLEIGTQASFGPYIIETKLLNRSAEMSKEALRDKPSMTERLDADCIEGPLTARPLKPGDRFWPIGLGTEKKAARFMIDAKTTLHTKKNAFVITDSKKIIWLCPLRLDDRVKVTAKTKTILEVELKNVLKYECQTSALTGIL